MKQGISKIFRGPQLLLAVLFVFAGVGFFVLTQHTPIVADTIGYIYAGERLAEGHGLAIEDEYNRTVGPYFSMYAFQIRRTEDGRMFFGFPPGLPFLLALGIWLTGQATAVHYVVPLLSMVGIIVTYLFAKQVSNSEWVGVIAAFIVALSPAYWQFGTAAWSEVPTMVAGTSGALFYLLSRQAERKTSQKIGLSLIGVLLVNYSLFIRYSNVTIFPAFALFELVAGGKKIFHEKWRTVFFIGLGFGILGILLFNNWYYGGPFLTNYSPENGWYPFPAFALSYALNLTEGGGSFIEAMKTLWHNFPVILLLVPIGWLWMKRPFALFTAVAMIITLALYSVYVFTATGINSRFLLPIFPFIAVPIAVAFVQLGGRLPYPPLKWAGMLFLLVLLFWSLPGQWTELQMRNQRTAAGAEQWKNFVSFSEPDAVFMSYAFNDPIRYYGNRSIFNYRRIPPSDRGSGRYLTEYFEPCLVQTINRLLQQDVPVYFVADNSYYWDVFEVVQNYYQIELVQESPNIYQITYSSDHEQDQGVCPQ